MIFQDLNAQDTIFIVKNIFKIRKIVKCLNLLYNEYQRNHHFTIDDIATDPLVKNLKNADKKFFILCWHKSHLPKDWLDKDGEVFDYETLI